MAKAINILVVGSNRGIGLQLVKDMVIKFKPQKLFATYRTPNNSQELLSLAAANSQVVPLQCDVGDDSKYPEIVQQVNEATKGTGLNLLVVNSGISEKPQGLDVINKESLMRHFEINSVSPFLLTKAFLPLLETGSGVNSSILMGCHRGAVVHISSVMGSIGQISGNRVGAYAYRSSKTALNMLTKILSHEIKEKKIVAVAIHPGWVRTDMGGPKAPTSVEESSSRIINLIANLNEGQTGQFLNADDGKQIPW